MSAVAASSRSALLLRLNTVTVLPDREFEMPSQQALCFALVLGHLEGVGELRLGGVVGVGSLAPLRRLVEREPEAVDLVALGRVQPVAVGGARGGNIGSRQPVGLALKDTAGPPPLP